MKRSTVIALCLLAGLLVLAVVGCELLGMTISGRISAFESSLNASTRNLVQHFHPDMVGRAYWAVESSWDSTEMWIDWAPFAIYDIGAESDAGGGRMSVDATFDNGNSGPQPIYFEFLEDGVGNWKIIYMECGLDTWGS